MTKLIVELGGDVHFETTCDPGTLNFVVGSGTSKYSAIRIASELKKVEFSKDREITNKDIDSLQLILTRKVLFHIVIVFVVM